MAGGSELFLNVPNRMLFFTGVKPPASKLLPELLMLSLLWALAFLSFFLSFFGTSSMGVSGPSDEPRVQPLIFARERMERIARKAIEPCSFSLS